MPLHGIGQSPQDSFLVMYLSTTLPSSFIAFFASGKSLLPAPSQFLIGASPFSIDNATAAVVPRALQSRRMAPVDAGAFMPSLVIKRYIQASQPLGLASHAMKRDIRPRSRLYSSVMRLHTALNSAG